MAKLAKVKGDRVLVFIPVELAKNVESSKFEELLKMVASVLKRSGKLTIISGNGPDLIVEWIANERISERNRRLAKDIFDTNVMRWDDLFREATLSFSIQM